MERIRWNRQEGNRQFQEQQWSKSILSYSEAIRLYCKEVGGQLDSRTVEALQIRSPGDLLNKMSASFSTLFSEPSNTTSSRSGGDIDTSILHVLYSNRSASFAQLERYAESLQDALKCIELSPRWPKGWFRKAEALFGLKQYNDCLSALVKAQELYAVSPPDLKTDSKKALALIRQRTKHVSYLIQDQSEGLRIVQLLAGRDFALTSGTWSPLSQVINRFAKMLKNHIYAICCERERKCVLVDVCWDVVGVVDRLCRVEGYEIVGAIVTHYHFDHVGGLPPKPYDQYHVKVDGLEALLKRFPAIKAYIHPADIEEVRAGGNDIPDDRIVATPDGFQLRIGSSANVEFIHTPGHTPGSQCLLVNGCRLLSGDTLFINNVGRLDFPDANCEQMYASLQKLKRLEGDIMVYPGHDYGGAFTDLDKEKRNNSALTATRDQFVRMFSGSSSSSG